MWLWYLAANLLFLLALLSKTVTATLPAALLVMIWWKQGFVARKQAFWIAPTFLIGIGFGLVTAWLEKFHVGAEGIDWEFSLIDRFLIAGRAICFYAMKLLIPVNLAFTYKRWQIDSSSLVQYLFPLAVVVVLFVLFVLRNRIGRGPLAAILLFAGTLFPALGFIDVYPMRFSFVADHFQYLASIGVITLVVTAAIQISDRYLDERSKIRKVILASIVFLLVALTWNQSRIYNDIETLWRDTIAKTPTSFLAHNNLRAILNRRGDFVEAEEHLRSAVQIKPDFVDSVVNLAKSREGQGDVDEAMKLYRQATMLSPRYSPGFNGLGAMYGAKGQYDLAEKCFREAVRLDSKVSSARFNLATLLLGKGQSKDAIEHLKVAVANRPDFIEAKMSLARALIMEKEFTEAEAILNELLNENPSSIEVHNLLGVSAASQEKYRTAIHHFEQIYQMDPYQASALYNLSALYLEVGDTEKSEKYQKALDRLQNQ